MSNQHCKPDRKPKVLLISGYDAASHQYWRKLMAKHLPEMTFVSIGLPARHFSWRMRGSVLNLLSDYKEALNQDYDLLIVTSMVDLACLKGTVSSLASVPSIVYFHENQFVYPISKEQPNILNAQLTSLYTAISADEVWFNSAFNRDSFLSGSARLLRMLPDKLDEGLLHQINEKSSILPVPIQDFPLAEVADQTAHEPQRDFTNGPHIIWNHRWEYDKQPQTLFKALEILQAQNFAFTLSVVGEAFSQTPKEFTEASAQFQSHIQNWGYLPRAEYEAMLRQADIVVSTAIHEFQGVAMLEAIAAGAQPVAPDRLVYPEYVPESHRYLSANDQRKNNTGKSGLMDFVSSIEFESLELAKKIQVIWQEVQSPKHSLQVDVSRYLVDQLIPTYRQKLLSRALQSPQDRKIR